MIKRILDIVLSALALITLIPVLVPIIIVLRMTGEGEVFYFQERIGRFKKPFKILKFATMLKNSASLHGGDVTVRGDPRILRFGRILRATKINEIPQLWNVFVGDMSIIGPRPLTPHIYSLFPLYYQDAIAPFRPGLSGIGSVVFRDEEALITSTNDRIRNYRDVVVPYKARLEVWYTENRSEVLDLKLIILTILVIIYPTFDPKILIPDLPRAPNSI